MSMTRTAETTTRPAAEALRSWRTASARGGSNVLAMEQAVVMASVTERVARMDDSTLTPRALDVLTEEIAALLARAEELRLAEVLAARAEAETWAISLDLD